jgi:putative Ca2+/H+ antiporter (TMEM165/GDT1 family)
VSAQRCPLDLAIAATVFPIIFIGELPDKTMFASLVMSTRGRPIWVWLGAAAAFCVHVAIATTIGVALFHVLPRHVVDGLVACLFLLGAGLAVREGRRESRHEAAEKPLVDEPVRTGRRTATTAFVVIFVAEWGDLTQILTANLAARYHSPASVALGALLALWAVAALAVVGGQTLLRFVNVATVRYVTAGVLVLLAGYEVWTALR